MRTVVNSEQVAHLWAHQAQNHARNSGGSMYFNGDTIYSYGSHFPMARHVDGVVLVNSASYSVTTSKHQNYTRRACSHLTTFTVPQIQYPISHAANFADYQRRYDEAGLTAARARKHTDWALADMGRIESEANAYAEHFGLPDRIVTADLSELKERAAEQAAAKRKETAERAEKLRERYAEETREFNDAIPAWRHGERDRLPPISWNNPDKPKGALLRVADGEVVTSQGARFPVGDVAAAWSVVSHCRRNGETFETNGRRVKLGPFKLDKVDTDGNVKAGCHYVEYSECRLLAEALGLVQ